jgi:hypothetical protein
MTPHEEQFHQQVQTILAAFTAACPNVEPPASAWLQHWLNRYSITAILDAIQFLQDRHPQVKAQFTTESTGKAISARLRQSAINRAVASAPKTGAQS